MKELSIKQKAERYDEISKEVKDFFDGKQKMYSDVEQTLNHLFPELKESEDERMWKLIKKYVHYNISDIALNADHITREQLESWLEKQGEKDKLIKELGEYKVKYIQETLGKYVNSMGNKDDERIRKELLEHCINRRDGKQICVDASDYRRWVDWLEKQGTSYTKKDVDDAYLEGISVAKNEMEKQYEANYQIRKDIATFIFNYRGGLKDRAKWMDYLGIKVSFVEKQGEKPQGKSALEAANEKKIDNQNCVNPTNNPEPEFREGEWVVHNYDICQIVKREEGCNKLVTVFGIEKELVNERNLSTAHLWTIQDAKDGDVLACGEEILLFKSYSVQDRISLYCWYNGQTNNFHNKEVVDILLTTRNKVCPATKEQRDLLFSKMKEAGYEWDAEKKKLKKIDDDEEEVNGEDYGIDGLWHAKRILEKTLGSVSGYQTDDGILDHKAAITAVKKLYEQKPTWTEEDEKRLNSCLSILQPKTLVGNTETMNTKWLKSLKERISG